MTKHPPFGQPKPIPEAKPAEDPNAEKNWVFHKPGIQINSVTGKLRSAPSPLVAVCDFILDFSELNTLDFVKTENGYVYTIQAKPEAEV